MKFECRREHVERNRKIQIREKYSKDQIIYAMKQGPIIRERFAVLSVCKALGWEIL